MKVLSVLIDKLKEARPHEDIYIGRVIETMKERKQFPWQAIRACGINSIGKDPSYERFRERFPFNTSTEKYAYIDLMPAIQICLIKRTALGLHRKKIVYPTFYG